jgi:cyclic beta-1,2-glucan synthetase
MNNVSEKNTFLYIDMDRLAQYSENAAKTIAVSGEISARKSASDLEKKLKKLKNICYYAEKYAASAVKIPTEVEWIIDNRYIAEREAKSVIADLKKAKALPQAKEYKRPVIHAAAFSLVRSGKGEVNAERLRCFLENFQNALLLTEKELSLFVPMVKLALVSMLYETSRSIENMILCLERNDKSNCFYAEELAEKLKSSGEDIPDEISQKAIEARGRHEEMIAQVATIFSSLRLLSSMDASKILEEVSRVEQLMLKDPSGIYMRMDQESRSLYRRDIARLAEAEMESEHEVAKGILELAEKGEGRRAHVGYYIYEEPLGRPKRKRKGTLFIGSHILVTLFLSLLVAYFIDMPLLFFLLFLPVFEIVKNTADYLILKFTRPCRLPRLELKEGIPEEGRTLCVISMLLNSRASCAKYAKLLEEYKLANSSAGTQLIFGLLADFKESDKEITAEDYKLLRDGEEAINKLNEKYGGGFYFFSRRRSYNPRDRRYMGWERKRGAIVELIRLIKREKSGIIIGSNETGQLYDVKYLILLDSDTRLGVDTARELVGAIMHPINSPVVDTARGIVSSGHGILQPRIALDLSAANRSDFAAIFGGQGGIDPYASNAGDIYQDLFDQGSFTGKGIVSVDAYHTCLNHRFPENWILSHDLLEGAYVRSGFLSNTELTDGFPHKASSYYDRMHRWTRGDWQILPWIFKKVRNENNEKIENPLDSINKWKIFDNLRRSLTPPALFICVYLSMFLSGRAVVYAVVAALISLSSRLLISSADTMLRPGGALKPKYRSSVISGFAGAVMQTFLQFLLLPYTAYVSMHAILTALYRMLISKKNMLAWVTAEDSLSANPEGYIFYFRKMFFSVAAGILALTLSPFPAGMAIGPIWMITPALACVFSREKKDEIIISEEDRNFLNRCASDIWRYFDRLLVPKRSFLPPDNWQEEPATGTAERTSPTNIGLAMLSVLAAYDLHLCTRDRAVGLIENILSTVERLPKWNGHLYNWYDIRNLKPLEPRYVSTVDSGNLVGCIIALIEGLRELEEQKLITRLENLISEMNFKPLYDEDRKLFSIGFDATENTLTKGWYDLLASEARQTSYIAIARGEVEKKHWQKLGRVLACVDGRTGMASWTGTMFEYFMPNLLMPCYKNSLIHESLKFCLYAQKKNCVPWGISESSFYAFDTALNYKYKAHGVQSLALKRGMERETVVSPYSTFLTLPYNLKSALKNLRRLKKLNMEGRYGFYEAADFTPARAGNGKHEIVKCFMVHHLGMSILAIDNVLRDFIMQRRFMANPAMSGHAELLQEKGPVGHVITTRQGADVPEKPDRIPTEIWKKNITGTDILNPQCTLLSNGAYTVLLSELGTSRSSWEDIRVCRFSSDRFGQDLGISFFLKSGTDFFALQPAPDYNPNSVFRCEFTGEHGRIYSRTKGLETCVEVFVPQGEIGEHRDVTVRNASSETRDLQLICFFEPVLSPERDYRAHPAFSKLSMETALNDYGIIVKRRYGARVRPVALCFSCSEKMDFETSREQALGRGGLLSLRAAAGRETTGSIGSVLDPCVYASLKFSLRPGESRRIHFALAVSEDEETAACSAQRILKIKKHRGISYLDNKAKALEMLPNEVDEAMYRLSSLVYLTSERTKLAGYVEAGCQGKQGLWRYGISGDFPVLTARVNNEEEAEKSIKLIREHALISQNGFRYDLVYIIDDGGSYHQPVRTLLSDAIRKLGRESHVNMSPGIHLIDGNSAEVVGVLAMSDVVINFSEGVERVQRDTQLRPKDRLLKIADSKVDKIPSCEFDSDRSFVFETEGNLNSIAWSHILANGGFGWLCTDAGTGNMWHGNAREFRINSWHNDPLSIEGPETIELSRTGKSVSLFATTDGIPCRVTYGFGFASWEKTIDRTNVKMTAFVHPRIDARVIIIDIENKTDSDKIKYFTGLILGSEEDESRSVLTCLKNDAFVARNLNRDDSSGVFTLVSNTAVSEFTCDKTSWRLGLLDGRVGAALDPCFGAYFQAAETVVLVCGVDDLDELRKLTNPETAKNALSETIEYWKSLVCGITIETPSKELDNYINGWALYQVLACRVMGRTSIYQSGGAYGFRDQLQDVCALTDCAPQLVREQILAACRHQYEQGDVQHWWHKGRDGEPDKGVRTRISDDLLWLPYTVVVYIGKTGDYGILKQEADYLRSHVLRQGEHDRYEQAEPAGAPDTVFNHCIRAIEMVLSRGTGEHNLLHIGTGDWNDGFDKVGAEGKGESVWLTWFAALVMERFSDICAHMGENGLSARYKSQALALGTAADKAWDGKWYIRGYYDNGKPLGSEAGAECKIDSIAQSFAVLSGFGSQDKIKQALDSAATHLFDRNNGIVKLFTPPFDGKGPNPGYIIGYLPGTRENGGQYTHAAIWLAAACLKAGMTEKGWNMLRALAPMSHRQETYKTEPYVITADVYANPQCTGRGGWSWYTGAAAWYYRIVVEDLLGIRKVNGELVLRPRLPQVWDGYKAYVNTAEGILEIRVSRGGKHRILVEKTMKKNETQEASMGNIFVDISKNKE